jgi:hypothetical protein
LSLAVVAVLAAYPRQSWPPRCTPPLVSVRSLSWLMILHRQDRFLFAHVLYRKTSGPIRADIANIVGYRDGDARWLMQAMDRFPIASRPHPHARPTSSSFCLELSAQARGVHQSSWGLA